MNNFNIFNRSTIEALIELENEYKEKKANSEIQTFFKVKKITHTLNYDYQSAFSLLDEFRDEIYLNDLNFKDRRKSLLFNLIRLSSPNWINYKNFKGREQTILNISSDINSNNIMQVLEDANLLHGESFDEEEYIWWTYLLSSLYNKEDLAKIDSGIAGEVKTLQYENKFLRKQKINKTAKIVSHEDSSLGYDVISWRKIGNKTTEIQIECKKRNKNEKEFFFSRNAAEFAKQIPDTYFIYFWNDKKYFKDPKIISFTEIENLLPQEESDHIKWTELKINSDFKI